MTRRSVLLAVAVGLAIVRLVSADDNVRVVQMKLRDGGFYSGEIDGAYSSQLAATLTGYQT
jgi:peptidoglycan hydrolase-like protein with peptidoglycan-binding domain